MGRIWFLEDEAADVELVRHELSQGGLNFDLSQITSEAALREGPSIRKFHFNLLRLRTQTHIAVRLPRFWLPVNFYCAS